MPVVWLVMVTALATASGGLATIWSLYRKAEHSQSVIVDYGRLSELEARIPELERTVAERDDRIASLEAFRRESRELDEALLVDVESALRNEDYLSAFMTMSWLGQRINAGIADGASTQAALDRALQDLLAQLPEDEDPAR